jgi:hypothetical protein
VAANFKLETKLNKRQQGRQPLSTVADVYRILVLEFDFDANAGDQRFVDLDPRSVGWWPREGSLE